MRRKPSPTISIATLAEALGKSTEMTRRLVRDDRLPIKPLWSGVPYRFSRYEVEAWLGGPINDDNHDDDENVS